jgi:nucleotide-binding universal stress UspA family protein
MAGIRVLVPFDRSAPARRGLEVALQLARVDRRKSQICPIYVVEVGREYSLDNILPQAEARAEACLAEAEAAAKQAKVSVTSILLQARNAGPAIVDAAVAEAIDLVVLGVGHADVAVGRAGAQTALARHNNAAIDLGSTADYVLSHAPCEVIVVREQLDDPELGHDRRNSR